MPFISILEKHANSILAKIHLEIHSVYGTERKAEVLASGIVGEFALLKGKVSFRLGPSSRARKDLTFQTLLDPAIPGQPVLDIGVFNEIGPLAIL